MVFAEIEAIKCFEFLNSCGYFMSANETSAASILFINSSLYFCYSLKLRVALLHPPRPNLKHGPILICFYKIYTKN